MLSSSHHCNQWFKCKESVWHSLRCLLEVTACGLLQAAETQLPSFVLASGALFGAGCFSLDPKAAENSDSRLMVQQLLCSFLPCVILSFIPFHCNIVSRIISVLLTFSQSWETYQVSCSALPSIPSVCVRPVHCQPSPRCSSAIIASLHFPLHVSPCPTSHSPEAPWCPCWPLGAVPSGAARSLPGWAQPAAP